MEKRLSARKVNPRSSEALRDAAGADWMVRAIDLRAPDPEDLPVRWRGVAIAGRGRSPRRKWSLPRSWWPPDQTRQPERILLIKTQTEGTPLIAVSYHAPPGVRWGIVKARQAVAFASWLSKQNEPLLFGAEANTPKIDAPDLANTRTHWHTGRGILRGEPGDDLLFGHDKKHDLEDALRRWLDLHPDAMGRLRTGDPSRSLAITYRTRRRKSSPGTGRRYDSVWVSHHWVVRHVEHLYEAGTRRDAAGVRLYTRNGNDFTARFLLIVASVMALPARSCLIDGEAIVSDESGLAVFELIRSFRHDHAAVLCAFDLLEAVAARQREDDRATDQTDDEA